MTAGNSDRRPVTMFEIALRELGRVAMIGGCCRCGETLAAYNAFPGRNGYWHCRACLPPDEAFYDLTEAHAFYFEDVADDMQDDGSYETEACDAEDAADAHEDPEHPANTGL